MQEYTALLDAGHGGLDANGNYHCIAHGKMFKHDRKGFHRNGFFYEGHFNRIMELRVQDELRRLGIPFISIADPIIDLQLKDRVTKVNHYHNVFNGKCFVVSLHANASPNQKGRGYEVFTSRGETRSDRLASLHYHHVDALLGDKIKMRKDTFSDGDVDKEANFYILRRTKCPAILVEHLFFDNYDDAILLMDEEIQTTFAIATALACSDFIIELSHA